MHLKYRLPILVICGKVYVLKSNMLKIVLIMIIKKMYKSEITHD